MKIYLIGMPGSGKTTIGNILAKKMNYKFIDIDDEIEKQAHMFIPEIFSRFGELYFRNIESEVLKNINEANAIVSCGGGIVVRKENKKYMDGIIFWLDVPLKHLEKRIENSKTERPLLKEDKLFNLYNERQKLYEYFSTNKVVNKNIVVSMKKIMEVVKCES